MKEKLRHIIEDNTSQEGRYFDYIIQFLILSSLITFSIEYILRIYVAKKPIKYIFSFYGIIDLISILSKRTY